MKTIKAILINPFAQFLSKRIEEIDLKIDSPEELNLVDCYGHISCDMIQIAYDYNKSDSKFRLIVDEEGLLKENTFFKIKDFGQEVFAGRGIIVQIDKEGYFTNTTEEDIKDLAITFPSAKEAIEQLEGEE